MRVTIERDALARALKITAPAVPKRAPNPALHGALLEVGADGFTVTCTDLDRAIRHTDTARVDTPGDAVVPAVVLRRVVAACGAGAVSLNLDDGQQRVHIEGGDGLTAEIDTLARAEWPNLPAMSVHADVIGVDAELREALHRAVATVSTDQTRPKLTGVWLWGDGLVSSADGYVGTHHQTDHGLPDVTIPGSTLTDVLAGAGDGLTLTHEGGRVEFTSGGTTWAVRCIDGDRPDVGRLIPDAEGEPVTVTTEDLRDAIASVASIGDGADESAPAVTIEADGGTCTLRKVARGVGEVQRTIDAEGELTETVGIAPARLAQLLRVIDAEHVTLDTHGSTKPTVIRFDGTTQIIMPVRGVK